MASYSSSIGALRSTWDRHSSDSIVGTLTAALLRMLDLRFVFVRLHDTTGNLSHDFLRIDNRYRLGNNDITVALQPWLSDPDTAGQRLVYEPLGTRALSVTAVELGSSGLGRLIVGAARERFPEELEELLLRAAVNEACVALLEHSRQTTPPPVSHSMFAAIVQNCSDFIGIVTLDGHPVFVNGAGRRMIGLRDDEPLPAQVKDYVAPAEQDRLLHDILPRVEREGTWDGEITLRHYPGGGGIPVLQHIFYVKEANTGRRLALGTICRDINERKRAEQALAKAQQELAHAARVLSIGELTASLAHEINQPLAAIVANAHASRRWLDRKVPNYKLAQASLENIVRDGNRASAIIQRVRSFSAKALPSRDRLAVNDVIREVVAIASYELAREQVGLRTHLAEDLPAVVADRIELQQVVLNLVINSIEALRPNLDRPKDLLITSARRNKSTVEVSVTDNGSGIDAQHIERMFDAFFTTKSHGMGLGLAISRRIIEAHNGTLRVTPNPQWGLTLAFTLPISRRRPPESPNGHWHPG
jgi:PAS domain S-box-containing protein